MISWYKMTGQKIKDELGPCGINCGKCFAYRDGQIKYHSKELRKHLGNFDIYAQRFSKLLNEPVFDKYPEFREFLNYLSDTNCEGCRKQECFLFSSCGVVECYQKKGVDYCFQCDEFPCQKTNFDPHLYKRWVKLNEKIRKIGLEAYHEEVKKTPRYQ